MRIGLALFLISVAASAQAPSIFTVEDGHGPSLYAYFQCANGNKAFCQPGITETANNEPRRPRKRKHVPKKKILTRKGV